MPVHQVSSIADSRLDPFRDMRTRNWTHLSRRFIAEGPFLVEQLLQSDYDCEALLVEEKFLPRFESYAAGVPLFALDKTAVRELVGFDFHRGIVGCGVRRERASVDELLAAFELDVVAASSEAPTRRVIAAIEGIQDLENIGGILRNCAGLGIDHVLIGPGCADPFSRRALRVSMGTSLQLNLWYADQLSGGLSRLVQQQGFKTYATCLNPDSKPLESLRPSERSLVVFGNEKDGLSEATVAACEEQVCIPMSGHVDSLNVAVAAGIVLHYFARL
ncbi:MAG: TrmH family RNA methyltransferase [Pirellulaceae bacterium]